MRITPMDIEQQEFSRSFRGYNEEEVDDFLDKIVKDYEELINENVRLNEEIEKIQEKLKEGDILELEEKEGEIVLKPVAVIPKSQQWFWQKEWLGKEKEASKDLKEGRYKDFKKVGDLLKDLKD